MPQKTRWLALIVPLLLGRPLPAEERADTVHHDLLVRLFPDEGRLEAEDEIRWKGLGTAAGPGARFRTSMPRSQRSRDPLEQRLQLGM